MGNLLPIVVCKIVAIPMARRTEDTSVAVSSGVIPREEERMRGTVTVAPNMVRRC